jgi:hypothetical protein
MTDGTKKKPGAMRQIATLLVALGLFALAAVVILPKLQPTTQGPVRLDILNGTGASMVDPTLSLRVPAGQSLGALPSVIEAGRLYTAYEGLGPVEVESIGYVYGGDSLFQEHEIERTLEPGGIMVLRIKPEGVEVDASDLAPQTP